MTSEHLAAAASTRPTARPFYVASLLLTLAAAALIGWLFTRPATGLVWQGRAFFVATGVVLLIAAAWTFVWPSRLRLLTAPLEDLPAAFMDARAQLADIQAIRKEYFKVQTQIEGIAGDVKSALDKSEVALQKAADLIRERQKALDDTIVNRKRLQDEAMNLRQSIGDAKRESEEWQKAALRFAEVLERTADPESGLSEAYLQAAARFAKDFDRTFQPLGLGLIRPAIDDPFDPTIHEAGGNAETARAKEGHVAECLSWGYMTRAKGVVSKARVLIARAPTVLVIVSSKEVDAVIASDDDSLETDKIVRPEAETHILPVDPVAQV